jgi:hypothetical protein
MAEKTTLDKQLDLINHMMNSVCEMSEVRLKELKDPLTREDALSKVEQSFQMLHDLCVVTRLLIKEVQAETKQDPQERNVKRLGARAQ